MQFWSAYLKTRTTLLLVSLALSMASCTRAQDTTAKVKVRLPSIAPMLSSSRLENPSALGLAKIGNVTAMTTSSWGQSDPTTIGQISCYAIAVGGPDASLQTQTCSDSSGNEIFRAGVFAGLYAAGSLIEVTVPSGDAREIYVIGFAASSLGACIATALNSDFDQSQLSAPFVLGKKTLNLEPGDVEVAIDATMTGATKFDECDDTGDTAPPGTVNPPTVTPPSPFIMVDTSGATCGVKLDGTLKCWGFNSYGTLGDGTTTDSSLPVTIDSGVGYKLVSTRGAPARTCGITTADKLKCWGPNPDGAVGDGSTDNRFSPVPVDATSDYAMVSVGGNGSGGHTCAITTTGVLKCWGRNNYGQVGDGTNISKSSPVVIDSGVTYLSVSVGDDYTCAITTTHVLKCWGQNSSYFTLGDGTNINRNSPVVINFGTSFDVVSASSARTCAITSAGVLKCWGNRVGDGTTDFRNSPQVVDSGQAYVDVSLSGLNACGLTDASTLKCWGYNGNGELGTGNFTEYLAPVDVLTGTTFSSIAVGMSHSCGITMDGDLKCWGMNGSGQLGNGTTNSATYTPPVIVAP
jgi:hypothetical protein